MNQFRAFLRVAALRLAAVRRAAVPIGAFLLITAPIAVRAAEPSPVTRDLVWLGRQHGATATEAISAGSPMVGMDVWVGMRKYAKTSPMIRGIAPIYAGADVPQTGPYGLADNSPIRIMAQPGYAVAGLVGRASDQIEGFRLIFMRLRDGKLDPKDQYESRWVGGRGAEAKDIRIAGDGRPVVGFLCRFDRFVNALALPQDANLLAPPKPEIVQSLSTEKLVREVERRGGKVVRDSVNPAHPVVEIDFSDSQLKDADLALLHGQTSLKRLDLNNGYNYFGENGLAHLESLTNLEYINLQHNLGQAMQLPLHLRSLPHLKYLGLAYSNDGNQAPDAPILGTMTNLEDLTVSYAFTDESMDHLGKLTNLRSLYIADTPITNIGAQRLRNFRKLRTLTVFSAFIGDDGYASLEDLHELEQLRLGGQQLTPAVLEHVKAPNLKSLTLSGEGFDDRVVPYLQAMEKLEDLHIRGAHFSDKGLAELNSLKHLTALDLGQCSLTGEGLLKLTDLKDLKELKLGDDPIEGTSLAALKNFPALEVLDLTKTRVTAESLANLKFLPNLREISLAGVRLGDDALAHFESLANLEILMLPSTRINGSRFSALKHLPKLKHLHLQQNSITDENATVLGEIPSLQDLNLEQTHIGDATLAALANLPNLEVLTVPLTRITDQGVESLGSASKLRELNVSNPRLTDAVIAPLLGLHELRVLGLNTTQITEPNVERLAELPHLRTLYIGATRAGKKTIRRMQSKSPQLKIFHDQPQFPNGRK